MSVYSTINKNQESVKKTSAFKKILPPKPRDDLAELFSDDEDLRKHKASIPIDSTKSKNSKL